MNRVEFMNQLELLLTDISESERIEAIQYYNDYFDDAGYENESNVIEELGSPEQVAVIIKDGLGIRNEQQDAQHNSAQNQTQSNPGQEQFNQNTYNQNPYGQGQYSQNAYGQNPYGQGQYSQNPNGQAAYQQAPTKKRSGAEIALIVLLLIITFPLWIGVVCAVFGVMFGAIVGLLGILFGFTVAGFALLITGIILFGVAIVKMFIAPAGGILLMGAALLILGIALLLLLASYGVAFRLIPAIIRGFVYLCRLPFRKRGGCAA